MSSILDALKKLEREHSRTGEKFVWPERIDSSRTLRRLDVHSGRFPAMLWVILVAVVIAAGGWGLVYWRGAQNHSPQVNAVATAPIGKPPPVAGTPSQSALPVDAEASPALQRPKYRAASAGSAPGAQLPRDARAGSETAAGAQLPRDTGAGSETAAGAPASSASRTGSKTPAAATPSAPKRQPLELLTEGFELQAISWSERAEDRMAVINGKIVREGAVVNGYKIARIDPEEVIVSRADRRWRVVFLAR